MTDDAGQPLDGCCDLVGNYGMDSEVTTELARTATRSMPMLRSPKIQDRHLERLAIVYVRQSSPQQVLEHRESRARQYALADYAAALGWPESQVLVIDEDQGRSGRSAAERQGFQRLLAELMMDHVGLVLGLEMSRLARSSKDWHHLLEVCALFGTLLGDQDGLYEPNDSNDRLLLGLKGTMSEVELFTMRNRLERGKLNKAERGELFIRVPIGYVKLPSGQIALEPDEQARRVVQLIFDKFVDLGSIYAVFSYLTQHGIRLGFRLHQGPRQGELEWRRPTHTAILDILKHPLYAGAYVFGRRLRGAKQQAAGLKTGRIMPMDQWKVLLQDRLPSYITWEQYLANQRVIQQNRSLPTTTGLARAGSALLSGLVVCGRCGHRRRTSYTKTDTPHYTCTWNQVEGKTRCYGLAAAPLDTLVANQVLRAVEPAALELSLSVAESIEEDRGRLHRHWQQQLQRARYDVELAERQYQLVDPENRLVARTLEQRWEQVLQNQKQLEYDFDRFLREQPPRLTDEEGSRIRGLASDIPALWQARDTTPTDRKQIIRCLIERIIVHVKQDSEYVEVEIQWHGGFTSQHEIVRPVGAYTQLRDYDQLMDRVEALRKAGHTATSIAAQLDVEGFVPPMRGSHFDPVVVRTLMARRGLKDEKLVEPLALHEWWVADLARHLGISALKLNDWARRGWVHARKTTAQKLWIVWADEDELRRLEALKAHSVRGANAACQPPGLKQPKARAADGGSMP